MKIFLRMSLLIGFLFTLGTSHSYSNVAYDYMCFSYDWNGEKSERGTMTLSVDKQSAKADIVEESWDGDNLGGKVNSKYRSRGRVEYVKFGSNLIVEKTLVTGGKKLKDGSLGGFARVEGEAEGGFYQYKFVCKRKEPNPE